MAGVISWSFNEDPKLSSATPFYTWPHLYKILPQWTEIKELFPQTGGWKAISYKQLRSQNMPPPALQEVSHTRDILPYSPPQAAAHPIPHGKAAGYYLTLIFQSNPTMRVFYESPKHQLRHLFLGFACPTSSRMGPHIPSRRWQGVPASSESCCQPPALRPAAFLLWNMHSWNCLVQMSSIHRNSHRKNDYLPCLVVKVMKTSLNKKSQIQFNE